jgi:hypothetical protein
MGRGMRNGQALKGRPKLGTGIGPPFQGLKLWGLFQYPGLPPWAIEGRPFRAKAPNNNFHSDRHFITLSRGQRPRGDEFFAGGIEGEV